MEQTFGIYIHVPFCLSKCPYCDFYSLPLPDDAALDAYARAVCACLTDWRNQTTGSADTLYFGGGTPSLLGGIRLAAIVTHAQRLFGLKDAEITLEANPADSLYDTFAAFAAAGGNRVSMGMQAADAAGLHRLGRRHTPAQLERAVADARRAGLLNLSLDIMLATPGQTPKAVDAAVAACTAFDAQHVSAYLLKVEEGTPFFARRDSLALPDEEQTAMLYRYACRQLESAGYAQYEISNFARPGRESRHNLKYWNGEPYIGIGPAAHGFVGGERYYYERSLDNFLRHAQPQPEDPDAAVPDDSAEEYAMLRLRLTDGLREELFAARFGRPLPAAWCENAKKLPDTLVTADTRRIALTREGFLLSNPLTARILWG